MSWPKIVSAAALAAFLSLVCCWMVSERRRMDDVVRVGVGFRGKHYVFLLSVFEFTSPLSLSLPSLTTNLPANTSLHRFIVCTQLCASCNGKNDDAMTDGLFQDARHGER